MSKNIRKATFKDLDQMFELYTYFVRTVESLRPGRYSMERVTKKNWTAEMRRAIDNPKALVLVYDSGNVGGFVIGSIKKNIPFIKEELFGYVDLVVVNSVMQGQGVGTILIKEMISFFKSKKVKVVYMTIDLNNKHSLAIWPKLGFKQEFVEMVLDI